MTTKAIQLAKGCCITSTYGGDDVETKCIETFYARAQAQAMREWAKNAEGYTNPLKLANDMDAAAAELESKT